MTTDLAPFSPEFRDEFDRLLRLRRDVREFKTDAVDDAVLNECLKAFAYAPSVGLSEPWRIVRVESASARRAARDNFQTANSDALAGYNGDRAATYAGLKLSGMDRAPVQLAVFSDEATAKGHGLGAATMPEMRRYSVVAAITQFWLLLRAHDLGLGWVSILDPDQMAADLDVPEPWRLVGYFCIGHPDAFSASPELEKLGWEERARALMVERR